MRVETKKADVHCINLIWLILLTVTRAGIINWVSHVINVVSAPHLDGALHPSSNIMTPTIECTIVFYERKSHFPWLRLLGKRTSIVFYTATSFEH